MKITGQTPEYIEYTRAQAIAARGQLSGAYHYMITDQAFGRLGAVNILLHAGLNEAGAVDYSQEAKVYSTFDNTAWTGQYDIDTNQFVFLRDNRGNEVYGNANVLNFDWGNTRYSSNEIRGNLITTDNQNTLTVSDIVVLAGASVNLTGASSSITRSRLGGSINLSNSVINITGVDYDATTTITAVGKNYTDNGSVLRGGSSRSIFGAGNNNFTYSVMTSGSLTRTAASTGNWSESRCNWGGTIQDNATGNKTLQGFRMDFGCSRNFSGNCTNYNSIGDAITNNSNETINGTPNLSTYYSNISNQGSRNFNVNALASAKTVYAQSINSGSAVYTNSVFLDYYGRIDNVSTQNVNNATTQAYMYGNSLRTNSTQTHGNGNKWRISTNAGYSLNTATFAVNYFVGEGLIGRTLTAANTTRYERAGVTNTLPPI